MPNGDALHPLIIHFPIALLLLSPLFVAISAALSPPSGRPYMIAAILVLLLGTASLFVARSTGKAAAELAERGDPMNFVLETHETLASETVIVFTELSILLLGIFLLPIILRRRETRLFSTVLPLTFLAFYSVGIVFLVNTAHAGGRLVHEFGVHALIPAVSGRAASPAAESNAANDDKHRPSR
ncbi:MAG: DUF2231 domain-containing protein [Acidobacteriaceae bacterium]